jgi:carboxymethylenebutenolidase
LPRLATSRSRRSFTRGKAPAAISDLQELIKTIVSKVPDAQVMSDLDQAVAYAKASGKTDTSKLAITGFCWGGRIVWLYSAHNPALKAATAWYGVIDRLRTELQPKYPIDLAGELKAPVLGLYGAADTAIPVETVEKMKEACKAANKTCEIIIYPDTPHGFNADYRPSYRAEQAKEGWAKMLAWFKAHRAA